MFKSIHKTPYNGSKGRIMDPKSKVERTGYVPAAIRIQEMIAAGERLNQIRADQYDPQTMTAVPLVRKRGIDIVDIHREAINVGKRLETSYLEKRTKEQEDLKELEERKALENAEKLVADAAKKAEEKGVEDDTSTETKPKARQS